MHTETRMIQFFISLKQVLAYVSESGDGAA